MRTEYLTRLSAADGWQNIENDGRQDFRWSRPEAFFTLSDTPGRYRLQLCLGTPTPCVVRLLQNGQQIREFHLEEGWKSLFVDVDAVRGDNFTILTSREAGQHDADLGVMVSQVTCHPYVNNSFHVPDPEHFATLEKAPAGTRKPFISAYYYLWYFTETSRRDPLPMHGKKWSEGYLRALLQPPQYPTLGEYLMNDPSVIEAHIDWAADHGIDCFICNWEGMVGHRKFLSENLVHILQGSEKDGTFNPGKIPYSSHDSTGHGWDAVSQGWHSTGYQIRNLTRMKFSILLESRLLLDSWPPSLDDEKVFKVFGDAITYCAENFFGSPQWQRIDGRPVIYIYEMYSWAGTKEGFTAFRRHLDACVQKLDDPLTGHKYSGVYIVADVVFPFVHDEDRFVSFDAVTGYNTYRGWTTGELESIPDGWEAYGKKFYSCPGFQAYYQRFANWAKENAIGFIPSVIPRYNDRGVRGVVDHYAFPPMPEYSKSSSKDASAASLFIENIKQVLLYITDPPNMLNINSWNEWFEDTAIEPVGYFPSGPYPDFYNQGANVGTGTTQGRDMRVPDKVVVYGNAGHQWIDTPTALRKNGIDLTQGFFYPAYGFGYLEALLSFFGQIVRTNSGEKN